MKNNLKAERYAMEKNSLTSLVDQINSIDMNALEIEIDESDEIKADYSISGNTAIIAVSGVILRDIPWIYDYFGISATSTEQTRINLIDAVSRKDVEKIYFIFDSPGGTVTDVQELAEDIRDASALKHIEAFVSGMCCSAAYWLAAQTSKITATKTSDIGSIGCYCVAYDSSAAYEKYGVKAHLISSGADKGAFAEGVAVKPEWIETQLESVNAIADLFIADVALGRGVKEAAIKPYSSGRSWLGIQALENGLIDAIGRVEDFIQINFGGNEDMGIFGKKVEDVKPDEVDENKPAEGEKAPAVDDAAKDKDKPAEGEAAPEAAPAEAKALIAAFGPEFGAKAISEDMSMEAAKDAFIEHLQAENKSLAEGVEKASAEHAEEVAELNKKVEAALAASGESTPAEGADDEKSPEEKAKDVKIKELVEQGYSESRAKVIAGIKKKK